MKFSSRAEQRLQIEVLILRQAIQNALQGHDLSIATEPWSKANGVSRQATRGVLKQLQEQGVIPMTVIPKRGTTITLFSRLFSTETTSSGDTKTTQEIAGKSTYGISEKTTVKQAPSEPTPRENAPKSTQHLGCKSTHSRVVDLALSNLPKDYKGGRLITDRPWTEAGPKGHPKSQRIAAKIRNEIWEFLDEDHTASNVNWTLRLCWLFATTCSRRELITEKIEAMQRSGYDSKIKLFHYVMKKTLAEIGISDAEFHRIKIDPEFLEQQRAIVESGQAASYAAADNYRIAQEEAQETHRSREESERRSQAEFMARKAQAEIEHDKREVLLTAENKRRKEAREKRFKDNRTTPEQQATRKQELLKFFEKQEKQVA